MEIFNIVKSWYKEERFLCMVGGVVFVIYVIESDEFILILRLLIIFVIIRVDMFWESVEMMVDIVNNKVVVIKIFFCLNLLFKNLDILMFVIFLIIMLEIISFFINGVRLYKFFKKLMVFEIIVVL